MKALNNFVKASSEAASIIEKNSPAILTGFGIFGMGMAMVFMHKATRQATYILEDADYDMAVELDQNGCDSDEEYKEIEKKYYKEAYKKIIPLYIPAVIAFSGSSICFIKSCSINSKRVAALTAYCALLETSYKEYADKVKEVIGAKKEEKIRDEVIKDNLEKTQVPDGLVCLDGEVLFYDKFRDGYFSARPDDVLNAVAEVNNTIFNHGMGFASLRDFYLEIDPRLASKAQADIGWNTNKPMLIRFSYQVAPNMSTCWCIEYVNMPRSEYDKWR